MLASESWNWHISMASPIKSYVSVIWKPGVGFRLPLSVTHRPRLLSSCRPATDALALSSLLPLARGRAWNRTWRVCRDHITLAQLAFVGGSCQMIAVNWRETGIAPGCAPGDRKGWDPAAGSGIWNQGNRSVSWPRMIVGYIYSQHSAHGSCTLII